MNNHIRKGKSKILGISHENFSKILIFTAIVLMIVDFIYARIYGINYNTRDRCIIYGFLPRWGFLLYEFIFELFIVVLLGVFAGTLIEQYLSKTKRFFPKNQLLAFVYASILPICSCGVIPLIETMKSRLPLRVIITFIVAAPLINPFIVALSFSVLGVKYAILRLLSSFILAILTGILVEFFSKYFLKDELGKYEVCATNCSVYSGNVYSKTLRLTVKLLPYLLVAGLFTFAFEIFSPKKALDSVIFQNNYITMLLMEIVGIPIYICNGADILILKPLLEFTDLTMGAAMIFSLTSSAICISSIVMLLKFLGKKLTFLLTATIFVLTYLIGIAISLIDYL